MEKEFEGKHETPATDETAPKGDAPKEDGTSTPASDDDKGRG